jgi:putative acetyltransferase
LNWRVAVESVDQPEAVALVGELDAHLEPLYPPESRYGLTLDGLRAPHVRFVLARDASGAAQGCGAVALLPQFAELKRMYVRPSLRGQGAADAVVRCLEGLATAQGYGTLYLETGVFQHAAVAFYERIGFRRRGPFGDYRNDPTSVFMEKPLGPAA